MRTSPTTAVLSRRSSVDRGIGDCALRQIGSFVRAITRSRGNAVFGCGFSYLAVRVFTATRVRCLSSMGAPGPPSAHPQAVATADLVRRLCQRDPLMPDAAVADRTGFADLAGGDSLAGQARTAACQRPSPGAGKEPRRPWRERRCSDRSICPGGELDRDLGRAPRTPRSIAWRP